MGKKAPLRAMMITNFDSTEQRREWNDLVRDCSAYPSDRRLWCRTGTYRPCERVLNDYTRVASYFAGIVRTAYMYCPPPKKIMLTDAQLLDGMFFLTLGPSAVNGVLGKTLRGWAGDHRFRPAANLGGLPGGIHHHADWRCAAIGERCRCIDVA